MQVDVMRMRLIWMGAMALLLVFAVYWGGSAVFGISTAVSIEWGVQPDLAGSDVEVDGKVVGSLEKYGQATRNAFPVSPGKHTIRVVSETFACPPREVELKRGEHLHLLVEIEEFANAQGGTSPRITFR